MQAFRNTRNQSYLDKLCAESRNLFFRLGRQQDLRNQAEMKRRIKQINTIIKQIEPFEKYNQLIEKETQMRKLLEDTQKIYDALTEDEKTINIKINQLETIKNQYLGLIQTIKETQQLQKKISALIMENKLVDQTAKQLPDKDTISNLLQPLNIFKKHLLELSNRRQEDNQKLVVSITEFKNQIYKESIEQVRLVELRAQTVESLNSERAKQITDKTISSIIMQSTEPVKSISQACESSYQSRQNVVRHNIVQTKTEGKYWNWPWIAGLVIWAILLLILPWRSDKIEVLPNSQCY